MSAANTPWIVPLSVLLICSFSFTLASYALYFRHVQIKSNLLGSVFIIPLTAAGFSFLSQNALPVTLAIAMGEIALTVLLILFISALKCRVRIESALFISLLTALGLCFGLASPYPLSFLGQELRTYLVISFLLTAALVILTRGTSEHAMTKSFPLLGAAQLVMMFEAVPMSAALALFLKGIFYLQITRFMLNTIHDEITKEVADARRLRKDFDDELRKEVKKQVFYMEMSQQKMAKISQTDALTEALNRKGIMDQMERLVEDRSVKEFSMLIFDIDNFKNVNDTLGHPVGDQCLKTLAHIARANLRDGDFLGRYGGDEFIILLPYADTETAYRVAERFRLRIQETENPHFTVSIGLATYPYDGKSNRELLEYADAGLYISKQKGRNRISRK